jgi:uncharacterized membrane protein
MSTSTDKLIKTAELEADSLLSTLAELRRTISDLEDEIEDLRRKINDLEEQS